MISPSQQQLAHAHAILVNISIDHATDAEVFKIVWTALQQLPKVDSFDAAVVMRSRMTQREMKRLGALPLDPVFGGQPR